MDRGRGVGLAPPSQISAGLKLLEAAPMLCWGQPLRPMVTPKTLQILPPPQSGAGPHRPSSPPPSMEQDTADPAVPHGSHWCGGSQGLGRGQHWGANAGGTHKYAGGNPAGGPCLPRHPQPCSWKPSQGHYLWGDGLGARYDPPIAGPRWCPPQGPSATTPGHAGTRLSPDGWPGNGAGW